MAEIGIIWADDADLSAIYEYVENQRPHIAQFPALQPVIEDFEKWYQGLSYYDVHIMINDTIAEAARRRDLVNAAMGALMNPTLIPADRVAANHLAPGTTTLPGAKPPLIPSQYKVAATVAAVAVGVLVVLKKLYLI